ncbi:hypothetical protein A2572_02050 [Candidatus Collierbacteria bacterium RIFOXYD1_FULL_40_9]|uniref:Amine oxidase domain-containing protein n=1 Tax=Candidatus Collierbacteria bacterium RIFOXYD1_FULL_40_9 TaxID=1817731 RepID=A0A1F5FTB5_9BACT|nr:MAG: hypothetical protein A2572_02050 [Candidatus Collierbacteria bacterium RIFOXYD1_FULL_40_9]
MKFAVIGSGFTGLACGLELAKSGHEVTIFEKTESLGGLAGGFRQENWNFHLEHFYHHIFANDDQIIGVANEVGCHPVFSSPKTSSFLQGKILQLDSPISVLKFSKLSVLARLRMGFGLFVLKIIKNGLFLEKYKVIDFLPMLIGKEAYDLIWAKLLKAKFGKYTDRVNMAWFWSRVAKRTKALGYFEGGFNSLIEKIADRIVSLGGEIKLNSEFDFGKKSLAKYNRVIVTTPAPVAEKITGMDVMPKIDYLWAQTLVLELEKSFMAEYWLNILEKNWPFLVVVEHTRFVNKREYGNKSILYLGNYLEPDNSQLKMTKEELLALYSSYLKKINPNFSLKWVKKSHLFRANYAQPVFPTNYSEQLKDINKTKNKIWFANMSMVYPYDRGTNYAIEIGKEVAISALRNN